MTSLTPSSIFMRGAAIGVVLVGAVIGCRHSAPGPAGAREPVAAPPADHATPADDASAAIAVPLAPASTTPAAEGCTYAAAAGRPFVGGISIVGLGDGGGGFDMPDICPQQACTAGLTIELPIASAWAPGVYDVEVATDDGTLRCRHTATAPGPWTAPAHCASDRELAVDCVGPEAPFFGPIMVSGVPARVRVTIARDGVTLADRTLTPSYSSKRWDGWDCDRSCASAKASVDVR